jgi:hypothetical protein
MHRGGFFLKFTELRCTSEDLHYTQTLSLTERATLLNTNHVTNGKLDAGRINKELFTHRVSLLVEGVHHRAFHGHRGGSGMCAFVTMPSFLVAIDKKG